MGFTKYIKPDGLTDPERKALKQLLQDQKKALQDALDDNAKGLAALGTGKTKKAKKKSKK
jgi:hypothetical protein